MLEVWPLVEKDPPHRQAPGADFQWTMFHVKIRRNSDGAIVEFDDDCMTIDERGPNVFNWEENNYSCDCNRKLFFHRALGEELEHEEIPCGFGEYSVELSNPYSGRVIYTEMEAQPHA